MGVWAGGWREGEGSHWGRVKVPTIWYQGILLQFSNANHGKCAPQVRGRDREGSRPYTFTLRLSILTLPSPCAPYPAPQAQGSRRGGVGPQGREGVRRRRRRGTQCASARPVGCCKEGQWQERGRFPQGQCRCRTQGRCAEGEGGGREGRPGDRWRGGRSRGGACQRWRRLCGRGRGRGRCGRPHHVLQGVPGLQDSGDAVGGSSKGRQAGG